MSIVFKEDDERTQPETIKWPAAADALEVGGRNALMREVQLARIAGYFDDLTAVV